MASIVTVNTSKGFFDKRPIKEIWQNTNPSSLAISNATVAQRPEGQEYIKTSGFVQGTEYVLVDINDQELLISYCCFFSQAQKPAASGNDTFAISIEPYAKDKSYNQTLSYDAVMNLNTGEVFNLIGASVGGDADILRSQVHFPYGVRMTVRLVSDFLTEAENFGTGFVLSAYGKRL